jgi:hypothetical protein
MGVMPIRPLRPPVTYVLSGPTWLNILSRIGGMRE